MLTKVWTECYNNSVILEKNFTKEMPFEVILNEMILKKKISEHMKWRN